MMSSERLTKRREPAGLAVTVLGLTLPQLVFWWLTLMQTRRLSLPGWLIAVALALLIYNIANVVVIDAARRDATDTDAGPREHSVAAAG
jgi:hypothetical protein